MRSTVHGCQYKFVVISLSVLLRMRNISHKSCVENQSTHYVFFSFQNYAVYEIEWKNIAERGRPQIAVWCVHNACLITKVTDTHSEYVIHIAFPLQQRLHKCNTLLCCSTLRCLSLFIAAAHCSQTYYLSGITSLQIHCS